MTAAEEVDYVVIGAGSAGCTVASRLSESGKYMVALLEAGDNDSSFWIHVPLGYGKLYNHPKYNWLYESEPEPHLGGARLFQPRGKVLGGSSSINGMIYIRGPRQDFDHWRQLGNVGWSYDDVLPYFRKAEDNARGADVYHGVGGPLGVSDVPRHEMADAFIDAAREAGYTENDDLNGMNQEGIGYVQATTRGGRRCSTAVAYLNPARGRANLRIIVNAMATRILFDGRQAVGAEYRQHGVTVAIRARREVVLAAGAFNSPQLLQLSGVGPAELLQQLGIDVVAESPFVGRNLQDHFGVGLAYRCTRPITINDYVANPLRRWKMGLDYLLFRKGPMASTALLCAGFVRSDPALVAANICVIMYIWSTAASARRSREKAALSPFPGCTVMASICRPESRGSVRIASPDCMVAPEIRFNHLEAWRDRDTLHTGIDIVRRIMSMPKISPYIAAEDSPGPACRTPPEIDRFVSERGRSTFHSTSTCAMGIGEDAVVDPRLRVRGVARLRVIDASVMPRVIGGNTNAAAIMIGEKGADMILEDARAA